MKGTEEYRIGNAIVRVHPGKRTPEERKAAIEEAMIWFQKEAAKQRKRVKKDMVHGRSANGS